MFLLHKMDIGEALFNECIAIFIFELIGAIKHRDLRKAPYILLSRFKKSKKLHRAVVGKDEKVRFFPQV